LDITAHAQDVVALLVLDEEAAGLVTGDRARLLRLLDPLFDDLPCGLVRLLESIDLLLELLDLLLEPLDTRYRPRSPARRASGRVGRTRPPPPARDRRTTALWKPTGLRFESPTPPLLPIKGGCLP
jgi:hypothetical protein